MNHASLLHSTDHMQPSFSHERETRTSAERGERGIALVFGMAAILGPFVLAIVTALR
jgi:hypothetical protein